MVVGAVQWQPRRIERQTAYPHASPDQYLSITDTSGAGGSIFGPQIYFEGLDAPKSGYMRLYLD